MQSKRLRLFSINPTPPNSKNGEDEVKHDPLDKLQALIDANRARERRLQVHKDTRSHKDALRAQEATTAALKAELEAMRG